MTADQDPWEIEYATPRAVAPPPPAAGAGMSRFTALPGEPIVMPRTVQPPAPAPSTVASEPWERAYHQAASTPAPQTTSGFSPETERLAGIAANASGLGLVSDISGGFRSLFDRMFGNTQLTAPLTAEERKAGQTIKGIASSIAAEPNRMADELSKSGAAMLRGDPIAAAAHITFAIPFAGAAGAQMQEYLDRGDIKGAIAHGVGAIAPFAAAPAGRVAEATARAAGEAAATTGTAAAGAARGAVRALPKAGIEGLESAVMGGAVGGMPGAALGFKLGAGKAIGRGAIEEARAALAARRAAADADLAAVTAPEAVATVPEVIPPERQIGGPPIVTPPPDTSYVRAVPATLPVLENPENVYQYTTPEGIPVFKAPAEPQTAPEAAAVATSAPAEAAPATGPLAQTPGTVEQLTNFAIDKQIPAHMISEFGDKEWKMVADAAGATPPTAEEAAQIQANVAQRGGGEPPAATTGGGSPDEPAPLAPQQAAVVPSGPALEPLPEGTPAHYRRIQALEGTSNAVRAFLKDQRVAQYVLDQGVTPEQWEGMTLDEQNQLVRDAPTASGKGKHRAFLPEPEPGAPRSMGRWAHEGVKDIADTMRWLEAQEPPAAKAYREAKAAGAETLPTEKVTRPKRKPKGQ